MNQLALEKVKCLYNRKGSLDTAKLDKQLLEE
jgi:hypothetical protein